MPEISDFVLGELTSTVKAMNGRLEEVACDVKLLLTADATTKERLSNGSRRFEDHESRVTTLEEKKFPWGKVVTIIISGFTVFGVVIGICLHFVNKG